MVVRGTAELSRFPGARRTAGQPLASEVGQRQQRLLHVLHLRGLILAHSRSYQENHPAFDRFLLPARGFHLRVDVFKLLVASIHNKYLPPSTA